MGSASTRVRAGSSAVSVATLLFVVDALSTSIVYGVGGLARLHGAPLDTGVIGGNNALVSLSPRTLLAAWPQGLATVPISWYMCLHSFWEEFKSGVRG